MIFLGIMIAGYYIYNVSNVNNVAVHSNLSMCLYQIVAEFERLLNIANSSLAESFKHNFHQVVDGIIELAREKDQKQMEFLGLLEADDSEDEGIECSLGMYSTVHASFRTQPHVRGVHCTYFTQHLLPLPCIIYDADVLILYTC